MLSLSGDGLRFTTRNIIFLITTTIILGCLFGIYFDLNESIRNESLYLGLFISSSVMFGVFLSIILADSFMNRDLNIEKDSENERVTEMDKVNKRFPLGKNETPKTLIGRDKIYYNNSFEKIGNIWRTLLFVVIALFIFISCWVVYSKSKKKKDMSYIIAVSIASLALAVHISMLIYQFYEFTTLDKSTTIPNIVKYPKDKEFKNNIDSQVNNNKEFGY